MEVLPIINQFWFIAPMPIVVVDYRSIKNPDYLLLEILHQITSLKIHSFIQRKKRNKQETQTCHFHMSNAVLHHYQSSFIYIPGKYTQQVEFLSHLFQYNSIAYCIVYKRRYSI